MGKVLPNVVVCVNVVKVIMKMPTEGANPVIIFLLHVEPVVAFTNHIKPDYVVTSITVCILDGSVELLTYTCLVMLT